MKISRITKSIFTNKKVLNGLEKISQHPISFNAAISLAMATLVRPASIAITPQTEKENKHYAMANSISSGLVKFATVEAIAIPIEKTIKKIDNNQKKFLTNPEFKGYKFATQILKLLPSLITAIPKSIITIALIPIIMDKIFNFQKKSNNNNNKHTPISFKGDTLAKIIVKALDNKKFQEFTSKYESQSIDIAKHIEATTDILLTATSAYTIKKSKNIKEERKKPLIYNNIISTILSITLVYLIDKLAKNKMQNFIEKFKFINSNKPLLKVAKYIEGIHIIRPTIISAFVYYGILPIFSTFLSEKISKITE